MNIIHAIQKLFRRRYTDEELIEYSGDSILHGAGFDYTEEDHMRQLNARKLALGLTERQIRLIDRKLRDLQYRINDREAYNREQSRKIAEARTTTSQPRAHSGGSTIKHTEQLSDRIADIAESNLARAVVYSTPTPSISESTYTSSNSYGCSSSSSSSSSDSSSSSSGCD